MAILRQLRAGCSALRMGCSGRDGFTIAVQVRRTLRQSHLPLKFTGADPLIAPKPLGRFGGRYYSQRSAIIGSTLEARRAGIAQANPDTKPRRIVPATRMTGSRGFPCAHFAMIWLRTSERTIPAKIPAARVPNADLK